MGRVIGGNFRLDRLIGSGATGNVYQAEQLSLGKAVAVKVLHPHLMGDEKLVKRFQREAKSASRLNHPNSVQIIESGQDRAGTLFIAMELLSGRDLADVIRDEFPLPVPRIIHIMTQVCAALDEAHAHGIIHRDLKPSNIMLIERRNEPDFVKVCDYGIAKASSDESGPVGESQMLTVQGLVCGTPEYMSPEQARGEVLDGRTDLYSAAVILYQMTTGDVPFRAATPIGIVSRHLSEVPIVPSSRRADAAIPADLDDLILRGLAKSRDLRPATAAIFREELQRVGTGGHGRRVLANAQTLPATDPAANGATTAEVVSSPKAGSSRHAVVIALVTGAVIASVAFVALRRDPAPAATPPGDRGAAARPAPSSTPSGAVAAGATTGAASGGALALEAVASAEGSSGPTGTGQRLPANGPAVDSPSGTTARDRVSQRRTTPLRAARPGTLALHAPARPADAAKAEAGAGAAAGSHAVARAAPGDTASTSPLVTASADEKSNPAATVRGPRELVAEGEKLLAEGEVAEACRRGEDAKRLSARLPAVYKFLGKCYMRAGNAAVAKEDYRHYLELAPNAPDAMFIESIVK